ncbi:hypothetical protein S40285_08581 [Stachybotrys chlorohalonatus IBT 40285]|uniref:Prion-inhibition and propagation HeLo domain-containing protein n=1 Tax=Stachybotrys chlorohalonatus (strain IBT 40285) TaxID=1283841 RepID=A0A084QTT4_STAC4|nr:hypothetical protein S40285_08581 [Stachybotrys chlorohalonata IBT 40285]
MDIPNSIILKTFPRLHKQSLTKNQHCISTQVEECLKLKDKILTFSIILPNLLQVELNRFEAWFSTINAMGPSIAALEDRLRSFSDGKPIIRCHLDNLQRLFSQSLGILSGKDVPWDELPQNMADDEDWDDPATAGMARTEVEQITMLIEEVINDLMFLGTKAFGKRMPKLGEV